LNKGGILKIHESPLIRKKDVSGMNTSFNHEGSAKITEQAFFESQKQPAKKEE